MRKLLLATAVVAAGLGVGIAQVQAQSSDPVAVRKTVMRLHAAALAGMNTAVAAKAEPKAFAFGATGLTQSAALLVSLFPAGSTANSRAQPAVWSDAAGFAKAAADLGAAAEQVRVAAAANDAAAFATAVKATSDACTACHRTFQVPR